MGVQGKTPLDWAMERNLCDFLALFRKYEVSNASPEFEQENGLDIVNDEELHTKIVENILCAEQKAIEFGGELDENVLNELRALDFSNCNATPPVLHSQIPGGPMPRPQLMYRSVSVDRRDFSSWPPSMSPSVELSRSAHPRPFAQISPAPISRFPSQNVFSQPPTFPASVSCPLAQHFPVQNSNERAPQNVNVNGILFESRYLKARCDALEKEIAANARQSEEAQNGWRNREAALCGQIKAQNKEITDLRREMNRMRSFLDSLPNTARRQFQNTTNRNFAAAEDCAEMPQRMKPKNFKPRRNHKHKKRNNKNNKWKSTSTEA